MTVALATLLALPFLDRQLVMDLARADPAVLTMGAGCAGTRPQARLSMSPTTVSSGRRGLCIIDRYTQAIHTAAIGTIPHARGRHMSCHHNPDMWRSPLR